MTIATRFRLLLPMGALAALLLLGGTARARSISISPTGEIDFTTGGGDTASQTLTVSNLTALPIYVTTQLSGSEASDFRVTDTTYQISAYGSQAITLRFTPASNTGFDTATLRLTSSMMDTLTSTLVGHATTATFQVTPEGTQVLNASVGSTATDSIRLRNLTNSNLSLTSSLSGPSAALFALGASPLNLTANGSGTLTLTFTPLMAGTDTAYLTLRTSSGDTERLMVIGHAMVAPPFNLNPPGTLVFNSRVGVADTENLTIRNITSAAIPLTLSLSGSNDFSVNTTSVTAAANGTTTVPIIFKSNAAGTFNGTLSLRSLTGDSASVSLIGHATTMSSGRQLDVEDELDFSAQVGQTECLPITIPNPSAGTLAITNIMVNGQGFATSSGTSMTLGADSTGTIDVCFAPTTAKLDYDGTLTFAYSSAVDTSLHGTISVELNGHATAAPPGPPTPFFLVTNRLEFNNIIVGQEDCQALQITNPTSQAVTIDSASLSGSEAGEYTVSGATMLQVGANSTQFVNVCLTPLKAGEDQDATLTLYYTVNGTTSTGSIKVNLVGNAIDTTSAELTNCLYVRHEHGVIGPIVLGGSDTSALFLTNRTNSAITINSATVNGSGSSAFSVTNTFPVTIQSGAQGTLMVAFDPTSSGSPSFGADITLNATGTGLTCGPITIHVEGVAVPGRLGNGNRDTSDIDLGTQLTGNGTPVVTILNPNPSSQACVNDTVLLTNTTGASMTINNVLIPTNSNITFVGFVNMSTPVTLAAGQSVNAVIQFCGNGTMNQVFTQPLYIATNQSIQPQVYSIQAVDAPAASVGENNPIAINFAILPNPSAGEVTFSVPGAATTNVEIYDVLGNLIATTHGTSMLEWNAENTAGSPLPSGQYIVRVTGTDSQGQPYRASRQMIIQH